MKSPVLWVLVLGGSGLGVVVWLLSGRPQEEPQTEAVPPGIESAEFRRKSPPAPDAGREEWDTEVFAEAAKKQLQRIVHHLRGEDDLDGLVAGGFACGALRPESREVFAGSVLRVRRGESGGDARHVGTAGLQRALNPLQGLRAAFKLFLVDGLETTVYFSAAGGGTEINATWKCTWTPERRLARIEVPAANYEEVQATGPVFVDCTAAALGEDTCGFEYGIDYWVARVERRFDIFRFGHHGLAIGDVNGDGLDDLYLCQPGGLPNRLLVQGPDGATRDHAVASGTDFLDPTQGALLLDLDNDGDQDLVLATTAALVVLANDGSGRFALKQKIVAAREGNSLAATDFDGDGDLDLFVCVYYPTAGKSGAFPEPVPYHDANNGGANLLLRNDGDFRFTDVTKQTGLDANNRRFTFAAAWEDYDDDGDADLYVANDFGRNNLYRNEGGRFVDVAGEAGVFDMASGMSVSWADYDGDGHMDVHVGNMFSAAGNRITSQQRFQPGASFETKTNIRRLARGNALFRNAGNGTFTDVSVSAGIHVGRWAWGSIFADINNDGWDDLLVANGYLTRKNPDDL